MRGLSVVIPVHRSAETLRILHERLIESLTALAVPFEIILVEDGGQDACWSIITALAARDDRLRGIRLSRNYGQANATLCGVLAARHEVIITMDDDLQHPPSEIPALLSALSPEIDVVYGTPIDPRHPRFRTLASKLTRLALASALGSDMARRISAFRLFRTRLREGFLDHRHPVLSIDALLAWTTTRFTAIGVRHDPRLIGASGYNLGRLVDAAANLMVGFTTTPLRLATLAGLGFMALGAVAFAAVTLRHPVTVISTPQLASLEAIVAFFAGVQLLALGIFGEYLASLHIRSIARPPYVIRDVTGSVVSSSMASPRKMAESVE